MKTIKCDLFVMVGYPHSPTCISTINVSNDSKEAYEVMNKAGWRKCGKGTQFGYFCPQHAGANQFYKESSK